MIAKFTLRFLLASIPLIVFLVFLWSYQSGQITLLKQQESSSLPIIESYLSNSLEVAEKNLQNLKTSSVVNAFINQPSPQNRARLESHFKRFAEAYQQYMQIRIIDLSGQETVRVDYANSHANVLPESSRSNKSQRSYFKNTVSLTGDQTYISKIELNKEKGRVSEPFHPVVRFGTNLYNNDGQKSAILVLNFSLLKLFENLNSFADTTTGDLMIISQQGDIFYHSNPSKRWQNLFVQNSELARNFTEFWNSKRFDTPAQLEEESGLLSYSISNLILEHSTDLIENRRTIPWVALVSYVPQKRLIQLNSLYVNIMQIVVPLYLILAGLFAFWSVKLGKKILKANKQISELSRMVEQSSEMVMITDRDGNITYVNPAFERVSGYSLSELLGAKPDIFRTTNHSEEFFEDLWQTINSGQVFQGVFINQRKDNTHFIEEKIISPIIEKGEIVQFVSAGRDITEHKQLEKRSEELHQIAMHDILTGLPNRLHIRNFIDGAIARTNRSNKMLFVLFIDLDDFKQVNDQFGHQVGDEYLQQVGMRLKNSLRKTDLVGRLAGDEFIAVLEGVKGWRAARNAVSNLLEQCLANISIRRNALEVKISVGVAAYEEGDNTDDLLDRADHVMYQAKKAGKNQVAYSQPLSLAVVNDNQ